MGAMENKGLNIFNSAYVLADETTATDNDYELILGVIGHEYFHNWSGNRVTVRDWFQLTLKEGLTVFRDQWFSADLTSYAVKRIETVRGIKSRQFSEDSSPMAHPIRPDSYISMDNFYTTTVYNKGSEIVGLYRTLLGTEGFKKGLKLYFERFDGKAVTCDDFRNSMADANNVDLSQLDLWYSQAGTPIINVKQEYDVHTKTFKLLLTQRIPTTNDQTEENKKPLLIPISVGLLSKVTGNELLSTQVLKFTEKSQEFVFENIQEEPMLSILRDFSAPVKLELEQSNDELSLLMSYDTDSYNRWDAGNRLTTRIIMNFLNNPQCNNNEKQNDNEIELPAYYINAIQKILEAGQVNSVFHLLLIIV